MYHPPMPSEISCFLNEEDATRSPTPPESRVTLLPHIEAHATPLVRIVLEKWPAMVARFHKDAANGLSMKQVMLHLGDLAYDGRPRRRDFREPRGLPIAKTLGWLERRRLLKSAQVNGTRRFVRVERAD